MGGLEAEYEIRYHSEIQPSQKALRAECLEKGEKSDRLPGMVAYFLRHEIGFFVLYQNNTLNQIYEE